MLHEQYKYIKNNKNAFGILKNPFRFPEIKKNPKMLEAPYFHQVNISKFA